MKKPEKLVVKKDMLSLLSTVQEILRALYFYGADYILVQGGKRERLLHKEQLVALLEQGREKATLEDTFTLNLNEPISAKMQVEDIPPASSLLQFMQTGEGAEGELSLCTFEEYRERKVRENMVIMPDWWGIPLPLVHIDDDRVFLNACATEAIPGGAVAMARQIDRMRAERIATIKEKKKERTFSLTPLAENSYFVEDISGDFEMAEDLVWWAAIGRAFVSRVQENGLVVKRLSPFEDAPENVAEVIPCHWENELVGRLAIRLPEEATEPVAVEAEPKKKTTAPKEEEKEDRPSKEPVEKSSEETPQPTTPKPEAKKRKPSPKKEPLLPEKSAEEPVKETPKPAETKPEPKKKTAAPKKEKKKAEPVQKKKEPSPPAILVDTESLDVVDEPAAGTNLRKSAAKNAYGMKGPKPAAKSKKTAGDEPDGTGEKN